jgi:hypothetical protein
MNYQIKHLNIAVKSVECTICYEKQDELTFPEIIGYCMLHRDCAVKVKRSLTQLEKDAYSIMFYLTDNEQFTFQNASILRMVMKWKSEFEELNK